MMMRSVFDLNRRRVAIGMTLAFQTVSFAHPAWAIRESVSIRLNTLGYLPSTVQINRAFRYSH